MTLKLTLQGLLSDRSVERAAAEPPAEPEPSGEQEAIEAVPREDAGRMAGEEVIAGQSADEELLEELAVAMGGVVERDHSAGEPEVDEDRVAELAMAVGAHVESVAEETSAIERADEEPPTFAPLDVEWSTGPASAHAPSAVEDRDVDRATPLRAFVEVAPETPGPDEETDEDEVGGGAGEEPGELEQRGSHGHSGDIGEVEDELADAEAPRSLDQMVVAVLGLRTPGLLTAMALRGADARVIGLDLSASRVSDIRSGRTELSSSQQQTLRDQLAGRLFMLTEDADTLAAAEAVVICVPTPVDRERRPDLEPLRRACAEVVAHARPGQTIVLTTTTRVGSTRELLVQPLEERGLRLGEDVFVAFSGDRVDSVAAEQDRLTMPRVLGAVTERCYKQASELLSPICKEVHRVSSPQAAEMTSLYESTYQTVNIALAFEMADACRSNGLDPIEVTDAAATTPAGITAHYPSVGVAGGSVGLDALHLTTLLRGGSRPATITEEALRKLDSRPRQIVWRAQELLSCAGLQPHEARVLVVGAAYEPGRADTFRSPAVEILAKLQAEGIAADYHDPLVPELRIEDETVDGVDPDPRRDASGLGPEDYALAILVTLHPDYDYGWLRRVPEVLDCTYRSRTGRRCFVP